MARAARVKKKEKRGKKVFVGLSGGVDSAVAAALLKEEGCAVTGVFIRIAVPGYPCTAGVDRIDAMRVTARLKIPFLEVDFSKEYEEEVFKPSISGFARGETPNPDILCNRQVKFGTFYNFCVSRGADFIATGHYARIALAETPPPHVELLTGIDPDKDQSYFLWSVPEVMFRHTLFPVGDMRKEEVRAYAKKIGLPNAERKDSQGLCFLGPISMRDLLARELTLRPGDVLSEGGEIIGRHEGAARYTLGQRHGFTITVRSAFGRPHYVIDKDVEKNTITVSPERFPRLARKTRLALRDSNWIGSVEPGPCEARYRYRQALIPANLHYDEYQTPTVTLEEPHYVPLGQSLVLYRAARPFTNGIAGSHRCLGGGIVDKSLPLP